MWAEWFVQLDLHRKQGMGISSMFKNDKEWEWMINRVMLFGLTALVLLLALLWVELLSFFSCLFLPTICCCWFLWNFVSTVEPHGAITKMSMLVAWTCVSFPSLGLKQFWSKVCKNRLSESLNLKKKKKKKAVSWPSKCFTGSTWKWIIQAPTHRQSPSLGCCTCQSVIRPWQKENVSLLRLS